MRAALALAIFIGMGLFSGQAAPAGGDECARAREMAREAQDLYPGDPAEGLAGLARAHALCPENPAIAYNLGLAQYRSGNPDLAYAAWERLAARDTGPRLAMSLGRLALTLGRKEEALAWARKARRLDRSGPGAMDLLVSALLAQGRHEEALEKVFEDRVWVSASLRRRVVACAVESAFRLFRSGRRELALARLDRWAETYVGVTELDAARDNAVAAVLDERTPLPGITPLPRDEFPPASMPGAEPPGAALVVGVAWYQAMEGVRFADEDAREFAHTLETRGGFSPRPERIRLLTNQDATAQEVARGVEWLVSMAKAEPQARVVFYFAGLLTPVFGPDGAPHKDELILCHDAARGTGEGRLSLAELFRTLREEAGDGRALAVLDGCWDREGLRANDLWGVRTDLPPALAFARPGAIRAVSLDRRTREDEFGMGLFTHLFLAALSGSGDQNADQWVDAREAFELTKTRLVELGLAQAPQTNQPPRLRLAIVDVHEN
ncbi:MAG: caspase family protein [Proteobacteria bacterium]|nr:caspase family protein [Pseudomonadota bacterium]